MGGLLLLPLPDGEARGGSKGLRLARPHPAVAWGCGEALAPAPPPRCCALVRKKLGFQRVPRLMWVSGTEGCWQSLPACSALLGRAAASSWA